MYPNSAQPVGHGDTVSATLPGTPEPSPAEPSPAEPSPAGADTPTVPVQRSPWTPVGEVSNTAGPQPEPSTVEDASSVPQAADKPVAQPRGMANPADERDEIVEASFGAPLAKENAPEPAQPEADIDELEDAADGDIPDEAIEEAILEMAVVEEAILEETILDETVLEQALDEAILVAAAQLATQEPEPEPEPEAEELTAGVEFWVMAWTDEAAAEFRARLQLAAAQFIDDPAGAVNEAADIVAEAVDALAASVREQLRADSDERSVAGWAVNSLIASLKQQHADLDPSPPSGEADTESLRIALRRHRDLLNRILTL